MKIRYITGCLLVWLLPAMGLANMSSMLNQMPTKQEMHVAPAAQPTSEVVAAQGDDAAQMAHVKAIMARDKKIQHAKSLALPHNNVAAAQRHEPTPMHTTVVTTAAGQPSQAMQAVQNFQKRLVTLNTEMILFQQRSDQKIENLSNNLQALKMRNAQLTRAMQLLNQELVKVSNAKDTPDTTAARPVNSDTAPTVQPVQSSHSGSGLNWGIHYGYYLLILVLLVLLAYYCRLTIKQKKAHVGTPGSNDDTDGEYDFLGSEEGITAKLNLARSYLAMGDFDQMRQVLGEVMQQGDTQQQAEAQDLLKKIV